MMSRPGFARRFGHFLVDGPRDFSDHTANTGTWAAAVLPPVFVLTKNRHINHQGAVGNGARFSHSNNRSFRSERTGGQVGTRGGCFSGDHHVWRLLFLLPE